jgi:4-hydroxy-3-methylbut-2-enyl diphosphate reductase
LIGHEDHDEVIGTMGEAPNRIHLVSNVQEVEQLELPDPTKVAYLTQTTLSVDDTREIIDALRKKFPNIVGPSRDDICYATQNRQAAVKAVAGAVDLVLVLGAANSSNANRLREVSASSRTRAYLINDIREIEGQWFEGVTRVGITAGASTPEFLVREAVRALQKMGVAAVREVNVVEEDVRFALPNELVEIARDTGKALPKQSGVIE